MNRMITKNEVHGIAYGIFFMAFFGTLWAGIGIGGLQDWVSPWFISIVLLVGIILMICFATLFYGARNLSKPVSERDVRMRKRLGKWFGIISSMEGIFIGLASIICNALNHFEYFFPVMALIVGIHFFPLAKLFRVRIHYIAGGLLCLLSVITLLFIPEYYQFANHQILLWWIVLGFGSAVTLWGTGFALWWMGHRLLRNALNQKYILNQSLEDREG